MALLDNYNVDLISDYAVTYQDLSSEIGRKNYLTSTEMADLYLSETNQSIAPQVMGRVINVLVRNGVLAFHSTEHGFYYTKVGDKPLTKLERFMKGEEIEDRVFPRSYVMETIGKCQICGCSSNFTRLEGHHIKPWAKGGKTIKSNCLVVCPSCHDMIEDYYIDSEEKLNSKLPELRKLAYFRMLEMYEELQKEMQLKGFQPLHQVA